MNWDQIEIKWAEMTWRVRADLAPRAKAASKGAERGDKPQGNPTEAGTDPAGQVPSPANAE